MKTASAKRGTGSAKATAASPKGGGGSAKAAAPLRSKGGSGTATAGPAPAADGGGSVTAALDEAARGSGAADGLPVAGYDGLTMAQLRARMRTLQPEHLRALIAYERAHAGRDEGVAMFERRIAKVESGG